MIQFNEMKTIFYLKFGVTGVAGGSDVGYYIWIETFNIEFLFAIRNTDPVSY